MRAARFLVAVLLAFLVAGCADPDPSAGQGDDPGAGGGPTPTASATSPTAGPGAPGPDPTDPDEPPAASPAGPLLTLDGCRNFGAVFPVAVETARAALPAGFEPVVTPSDPAGGATLYVLGVRCTGSSVDGAATGPVDVAYAELAVVPPAEHAVAGRSDATVPLAFAASSAPVGVALAELGFANAGLGEVGWAEHGGVGDLVVTASVGGVSFTLRGAYAPGPAGGVGSGDFVLYGVQDGAVRTTVLGTAAGDATAVDAAVTLEAAGLDVLEAARPAARGFSVDGFSLRFQPA